MTSTCVKQITKIGLKFFFVDLITKCKAETKKKYNVFGEKSLIVYNKYNLLLKVVISTAMLTSNLVCSSYP